MIYKGPDLAHQWPQRPNPGSTHRSPSDHTDGWTDSQYISTTTDKKRAQQINKDGDNAGVLKINTDKIPGFHNDGHVDMVKHTEGSSGLTKTWANFNKEVLVKNHIPADACKLIRRDVGDLFRRAAGCAGKKSADSGSPKTAAGKGAAGSTQSARTAKPAAKSTAAAPAAKKATKPASGGGRKNWRGETLLMRDHEALYSGTKWDEVAFGGFKNAKGAGGRTAMDDGAVCKGGGMIRRPSEEATAAEGKATSCSTSTCAPSKSGTGSFSSTFTSSDIFAVAGTAYGPGST
ncbi:hypothetical protein DFJ73DRAFT_895703 [Zopfochytrium polystomum]|nr:hypothetical protein DFJ73DRAFT_895703 [Zopfochytrium polystomum]